MIAGADGYQTKVASGELAAKYSVDSDDSDDLTKLEKGRGFVFSGLALCDCLLWLSEKGRVSPKSFRVNRRKRRVRGDICCLF